MSADEPSAEAMMLGLLPETQKLSRAPISHFLVGAVARGRSGAFYQGANLEFPGCPLSWSVHAEQAAVLNAWDHGETGIDVLAVTAAPCGYCRQFLTELAGSAALRILLPGRPPATLADLLPASFGPSDLGVGAGLLVPRRHELRADQAPSGNRLAAAALEAARTSYAPYTRAYAGVALELGGGEVVTGRYAENAAFSPSLSPLQAALAAVARIPARYDRIRRIVLAEVPGPAGQRAAAEALLAAVVPGVALQYVRALPAATIQESEGLDSTDTSALS